MGAGGGGDVEGRADYAQGAGWVKARGRREVWLELRTRRERRGPRGG